MILPYHLLDSLQDRFGEVPASKKGTHTSWDPRTRKKKIRGHYKANKALDFIHRQAMKQIVQKMFERGISLESAKAWIKGKGLDEHFTDHVNTGGMFNRYWFTTDIASAFSSVDTNQLAQLLFKLFLINPNPYYDPDGELYRPVIEVDYEVYERVQQATQDFIEKPGAFTQEEMVDFYKRNQFDKITYPHKRAEAQIEKIFKQVPVRARGEFLLVDLEWYLKKYFINPDTGVGLVEGYSCSQDLFNLYCEVYLDTPLREVCKRYQITYTRYGDDCFFSSDILIGAKKKKAIKQAFSNALFQIKNNKTHYFDLEKRGTHGIELNGIRIRNRKGSAEMFLPQWRRKRIKGMLFELKKKGASIKLSDQVGGNIGYWKYMTRFLGRTFQEATSSHKQMRQMVQAFYGYDVDISKLDSKKHSPDYLGDEYIYYRELAAKMGNKQSPHAAKQSLDRNFENYAKQLGL